MGTFAPFPEDMPFEEKVKCLADDELVEIWAQSQQIENIAGANLPAFAIMGEYERAIINELCLRAGRKLQART